MCLATKILMTAFEKLGETLPLINDEDPRVGAIWAAFLHFALTIILGSLIV